MATGPVRGTPTKVPMSKAEQEKLLHSKAGTANHAPVKKGHKNTQIKASKNPTPAKVKGDANPLGSFKVSGGADLNKLVAPRTHVATGGVAGSSLEALKSKLLGKSADPVAALFAKIEGLPDSKAAEILAEELINSNVGVA